MSIVVNYNDCCVIAALVPDVFFFPASFFFISCDAEAVERVHEDECYADEYDEKNDKHDDRNSFVIAVAAAAVAVVAIAEADAWA